MLYEERVERDPPRGVDARAERRLRLLRGARSHNPEAVRDAVDVGVDRHRGDAVAEDEDAVRGLRSDPGEARELGEGARDRPAEPLLDRPRARPDRPALGPVEPDRADQRKELVGAGGRERPRVGEPGEEARRGAVRRLVARPLGQDRPDQDLERVLGVVAQVRAPPRSDVVEPGEPLEEELPIERGAGPRAHAGRPPGPGAERGRAAGASRTVTPGSARSGSSDASWPRRTSPTR